AVSDRLEGQLNEQFKNLEEKLLVRNSNTLRGNSVDLVQSPLSDMQRQIESLTATVNELQGFGQNPSNGNTVRKTFEATGNLPVTSINKGNSGTIDNAPASFRTREITCFACGQKGHKSP